MSQPITVRSCAECPFFLMTARSLFVAFAVKREDGKGALYGECGCPSGSGLRHYIPGSVGPEFDAIRDANEKRMKVTDGHRVPAGCPLRSKDVLVTLGS